MGLHVESSRLCISSAVLHRNFLCIIMTCPGALQTFSVSLAFSKMPGIRNNIAEIGALKHCWNVKWLSCRGKQFGGSSKKLNIELPRDPGIPLLGIYPTEMKTGT